MARAADERGQWWARMSRMVQQHTGRPMKDDVGRFDGSSPGGDRSAICDAMTDAYAGEFRHVGMVRGLARQVAVRDVDNMIAASDVPQPYRAILDQRVMGDPAGQLRDQVRQVAAEGFVETLSDRFPNRDVARDLLSASHGPAPQTSPMRTAATVLFRSSPEAQAQIPVEQHENAISSIQQQMENHARTIDAADLTGHSGLPPRAFDQTLLEARMTGSEVAGIGLEAVEKLAHPPAPTGRPLAAVEARAAQAAATSGVAATGAPTRPDGTPAVAAPTGARVDPRVAYQMGSQTRPGAREA
ncbi:hypothetical protein AB0L70_04345 [Kribbella sp. NPDC051952]|uniref:hypothetical protein n=1 Tax=Kribbella sp. NPDC051952 TaxID=3154851 RepID=UPI003441A5BF